MNESTAGLPVPQTGLWAGSWIPSMHGDTSMLRNTREAQPQVTSIALQLDGLILRGTKAAHRQLFMAWANTVRQMCEETNVSLRTFASAYLPRA